MKKVLSFILVLVMLFSFMPQFAVKASENNNTCTVSFDMGTTEISQYEAINVKIGNTISPEDPVWQGHTFLGWFPTKECVNKMDLSEYTFTEDKTIYAGWVTNNKIEKSKELASSEGWVEITKDTKICETDTDGNIIKTGIRLAVGVENNKVSDVFFGNNYIEIGMHKNGSFGARTQADTNIFHPSTASSTIKPLGLRISSTGWEKNPNPSGTVTKDFTWGNKSVDEGWLISINNQDTILSQSGTNGYMYGKNLKDAKMYYKLVPADSKTGTDAAILVKTVVETTENLIITQTISLYENDKGYDTWVDIKNTSDETYEDVVYYRAFDPNQAQKYYKASKYNSDIFNYTDECGNVYVIAGCCTYDNIYDAKTIGEMLGQTNIPFCYYVPASIVTDTNGEQVYSVVPIKYSANSESTTPAWSSSKNFKVSENCKNEIGDYGIGFKCSLGDIKSNETKSIYYYSSLDESTNYAAQTISEKAQGISQNSKTESFSFSKIKESGTITLSSQSRKSGRLYVTNKVCLTIQDVLNEDNQLLPGISYVGRKDISIEIPASAGGIYYIYYADDNNNIHHVLQVNHFNVSALGNQAYTGDALTPTFTIKYSYYNSGTWTEADFGSDIKYAKTEYLNNKKAGKATVKINIDYSESTGAATKFNYMYYRYLNDVTFTLQFYIGEASEIEEGTSYNGTYDGNNHELVSGFNAKNGTMYYMLGTNATDYPEDDDPAWSTEIPKAKDAGTYYVWYKCVGDAGYRDIDSECATATISKREVTLTSGSASKKYNKKALINQTITVTGDGFVDGEGYRYEITGSQTEVGSSKNTFTYELNEGTKAGNYEITTVEGDLIVISNPKPKRNETLRSILRNIGNSIEAGAENLFEEVADRTIEIVDNTPKALKALKKFANRVVEETPNVAQEVVEKSVEVVKETPKVIEEVIAESKEVAQELPEDVKEVVETIVEAVPEVQEVVEEIVEIPTKVDEAAFDIVEVIDDVITGTFNFFGIKW